METKKLQSNFLLKQDKQSSNIFFHKLSKHGIFIPCLCFLLVGQPICFAANNQASIRQFQQRIIDNPKDVDAHLRLAVEYSKANDFVKAVQTYFALLKIDPNNFHAYNNLGILYKQSGQYRDSLHCYQEAQRIDPDSYWVPYNMGLCYEAIGRMQEARESYGQALSLNPSFSQALQRLRALSSDGNDKPLPKMSELSDAQIYTADSRTSKPVIKSQPSEAPVVISKNEKSQPKTAVTKEKVEKISDRLSKEKNEKTNLKHRTKRKGSAAMVFNQAMDALESGKMELAIELYINSVIAERELLAEPENDLIRQGLKFLKDRPNRMPNGLFFRGMLIHISGHLDLAVADMKNYIAANSNSERASSISQYLEEAQRIIDQKEAEKQALAALEKERAEAVALAEQQKKLAESGALSDKDAARPSDYALKRMNIEQIIQEADKLSRESRLTDAVAVLENGLSREPDNIRLLMRSANAYADMLMLKGDNEAGKMALIRFKTVAESAQPNSREASIAREMVNELNKRVR